MSDLKQTITDAFVQYSGAVLQSRALVDARDCLKPSARQIFYSMYSHKLMHTNSFKKTVNAVGMAMVDFYIHGDTSAEGIIMRAGQPFAMRYPLIEVEGNGGSPIESGNWAAMRYTSARLSEFSNYLFTDIKKDTIAEWRNNYDDTQQYPAVLPSKGFYNIVNGTTGIGIGMASSVPQFNIKDINLALEKLTLNPNCTFDDIYCAPDFATGAILVNASEVKEAIKNGHGASCKLRSVINYDAKENCLEVTEVPYGVYTNTICKELEEIEQREDNPGIERHNDLTKKTVLIKIYLHKGVIPEKVIRYLYKETSLQYYFGINFTLLDAGRFPKVFTWKQLLQAHIDHEKDVYRRGFEYDINQYRHRIHIIDGLLICLANIDEVIAAIKQANSVADAKTALIKNFILDEDQAQAVLDMKLSRLAHLEIEKLKQEKTDLYAEIARIEAILNDAVKFNNELIAGWRAVAKKYGDSRRTQILDISSEKADDEAIAPENCMIILTHGNTIKRIPSDIYKPQKRKGKGVKIQDELTSMIIRTTTADSLMIFSDSGKLYRLPVADIPNGDNKSKGIPVDSLVAMEHGEHAQVIYSLYRNTKSEYVCFITKQGYMKKTELSEYTKTRKKTGLSAITLREGDQLANVVLLKDEDVIVVTKKGYALRLSTTDWAASSRLTVGNIAINLKEDDEVVCVLPIHNDTDDLGLFFDGGYGKRVRLNEIPKQNRRTRGIMVSKGENDIVAATLIQDGDQVLIFGDKNSILLEATEIPVMGRAAQGNLMIQNKQIKSVSKI